MNNEQIVNSIKALCQERNITITKLEETLGMSQGLISRWNKSDPSLSKIIDIANYFKVSLDEIVGNNNNNNVFLNALTQKTTLNLMQWNSYSPKNTSMLFSNMTINDFRPKDLYPTFEEEEIIFYSYYNDSIIILYSLYNKFKLYTPLNLTLYIIPTKKSKAVPQNYLTEELLSLYLKVLNVIHSKDAPDEIKTEEFKHSFVLEFEKKEINCNIETDDINLILNNSSIKKLIETFNTPEFQKLQQTFSNPEFQKAIQTANALQQKLNNITLPIHQKED